MSKRGKKYSESKKRFDSEDVGSFNDAVKMTLESSFAGFDETIDVAVRLGVDPRHADQMVRGSVVLPHGTGKDVKVAVFAKGEKEKEALEAGADYAGSDDLVEKIKANRLELADLEGGTFTVSNGGVYGSLLSTPILNMPQSGILGMHKTEKRPVVVDDEIVIRPMMYVALSYDHRIVDGKGAVTFLKRVKEFVENPERMALEV